MSWPAIGRLLFGHEPGAGGGPRWETVAVRIANTDTRGRKPSCATPKTFSFLGQRVALALEFVALLWLPAGVHLLFPPREPAYRQARYRRDGQALLPDPRVTPGATVPGAAAATVCRPGYATRERNVSAAVKRQVYAEYHATRRPGVCCEVDHLISLELGGGNAVANLWPEPYKPVPGAHEKDRLENYLHRQVCSGTLPLAAAQRELSTDWAPFYRRMSQGQVVARARKP